MSCMIGHHFWIPVYDTWMTGKTKVVGMDARQTDAVLMILPESNCGSVCSIDIRCMVWRDLFVKRRDTGKLRTPPCACSQAGNQSQGHESARSQKQTLLFTYMPAQRGGSLRIGHMCIRTRRCSITHMTLSPTKGWFQPVQMWFLREAVSAPIQYPEFGLFREIKHAFRH